MENVTNWLLSQEPYIRYRTIVDFNKTSLDPKLAYTQMLESPPVKALISEIGEWPGAVIKRHNDAKLLYHKLSFLSELGIRSTEPEIQPVIEKILDSASAEGPFQIVGNIPTVFGGSGKDEAIWMLCDAPVLTYILVKFGLGDEIPVKKSVDHLLSLIKEFGWPCSATSALGSKFKGPGKRTHPCPYGNLLMLKLLVAIPEMHRHSSTQSGIDMILDFWQQRKSIKYFLFGMGADFSKLKAPFIWFDILHVVEVLSQFNHVHSDLRFQEMVGVIQSKADDEGLYRAESVFRAWSNWNFGQKKEASAWITFLICRMLKRIGLDI